MADPPPIRGSSTQPPPIPGIRAGAAPPAGRAGAPPDRSSAEPSAAGDPSLTDDTSSLWAPDGHEIVERVLAVVALEAAALLAGDPRGTPRPAPAPPAEPDALAALSVRTALATWDAIHQPEAALRLLELAESHPLAPRLALAAALATGDPRELAARERAARGLAPRLELAEAWAWRLGRLDRATALLDEITAAPERLAEPGAEAALAAARELGATIHAATGAWPRAAALRASAVRDRADAAADDPCEVAAAAALALDREGDPATALALCRAARAGSAGAAPTSGASALGALRLLDVAIAAAVRAGPRAADAPTAAPLAPPAAPAAGAPAAPASEGPPPGELAERASEGPPPGELAERASEGPPPGEPAERASEGPPPGEPAERASSGPPPGAPPAAAPGATAAPATAGRSGPSAAPARGDSERGAGAAAVGAAPGADRHADATSPLGLVDLLELDAEPAPPEPGAFEEPRTAPDRRRAAAATAAPAAAWDAGDDLVAQLLLERAALVAALPGGALEALATRAVAAAALERGDHEGAAAAAARWAELAEDPAALLPGAARRVALARAAHTAAASAGADARAIALAAHRSLADCDAGEVAAAHAWRALELAALTGDADLAELAGAVREAAASPAAERWLDQLELAAPTTATLERLAARGGHALRWAAALAERLGDPAAAERLWRATAAAPEALPAAIDHVARLHRAAAAVPATAAAGAAALSAAYLAWSEREPTAAAVASCARGVIELVRGDFVEAEAALLRAARAAPADPFSRIALAELYRAGRRFDQLAVALGELGPLLTSREARGAVARERAELLASHLGDPAGASAMLEQALAEHADDVDALLALARLRERAGDPGAALALLRRAAPLASGPARAGEIWLAIARSEERRGDRERALGALERAAAERHPDALRERARLHREAGDLAAAAATVRAELAAAPPPARRAQLLLELAQLLTALGDEPAAVVTAYAEALSIEPGSPDALAGIVAPARALGQWEDLARVLRGAPPTAHGLAVLAEALTHLADWRALAEVRRRQLELAVTPAERASLAGELAAVVERELGDRDGAIRALQQAVSAQPDAARQRDLARLLRAAERWADLAAMLERELPTVRPEDADRQVEILLDLGALRAEQLGRAPEAIQAYEAVLELRPLDPAAGAALERLYGQLGRDRDLARLLEARADAELAPPARAALYARVGELRAARGELDGAIAAYTAAFTADPADREVFTALERLCYQSERWGAAMQLYERAIQHVQAGHARAYRLGDLHARRGNVQLNFLGQVDAAIESYQLVVEVDSQPQSAHDILADLCRHRGDFAPLIHAWERRAEAQRDPQRKADSLRAAARLAAEHGAGTQQAMRLNQKLLAVAPDDAAAAAALERYYESAQDRTGLVELLKLRLSVARDSSESLALLRRIARAAEDGTPDVAGATEHYHKILELQPENREALEALGRIYESTERWAELIEVTRRLIKVTGDRSTRALLFFRCGSVMEAKFGREEDALRYYDAAIKTSSSCLPAVHGLRDLYRRREEWPRVIESLELEVKLWSDDKERAGVYAQIGRIYEVQLADAQRAMSYYESALAVDPDCVPANQALFEHCFAQGEWERALTIANLLVQKATRDGDPAARSDFYRKRGVVARRTGDPRGAAESIIVALEVKPTNAAALEDLGTLARERPDAWDFEATYRELDKLYKRRDDAGPLLARVHLGRAAICERDGDRDGAAALYQQAVELAPDDLTVLRALVDFHADMRHWTEALAALDRFTQSPATAPADRIAALMRRAAIHGDGQLDAARAIATLQEVLAVDPAHQEAHYQLAQQRYLLGETAAARAAIERVIELATAPGQPLGPAALARYYYYRGRILDAAGEARAAAPQYRRASEYDPGYAPPALVLARRAAEAGDQRQAEVLLIEAAHAAMAHGGPRAAVPLQRGLARILLASGDRPAAIEAYRGILNVEPESASDRVALAEIYAVDEPTRAIGELRKVLDRDIHHAPAYRLLAEFYVRTGDRERALRVLTALDLLGFAEEADRAALEQVRAACRPQPLRRGLDAAHRARLLLTQAARDPLGEVFAAFAEALSAQIAPPSLGTALQAAQRSSESRLLALAAEVAALWGVEPELFLADRVPGLAAITAFPRRVIVIDRALLGEPEPALRYLLGYACEAIRGGYAVLHQVGARQRRELALLLRNLLAPAAERTGPAAELAAAAPAAARRVLDRHAGARDVDPELWIDGMLALAKRAGLVACDDFTAAIWMVARLAGERLESRDDAAALGAVLGGPDLVRFYLSDDYQQVRDLLTM